MSERVYILGWGPWRQNRAGFGVSLAARSPRFQPNEGVLRREMGWPLVFTVFLRCLWVWKGRTDVSERVYRLGRGPWRHKRAGFGWNEPDS